MTPFTPTHSKSKFIWDSHNMQLIGGKAPTKEGHLVKGEDQDGVKMELVGSQVQGAPPHTPYWGWSS